MMRVLILGALALLALPQATAAPSIAGDPTEVILYGHFEDVLNAAPLTTQPPDPAFEKDVDAGFVMPVIHAKTGICAATACADSDLGANDFDMFLCPGRVRFFDLAGMNYDCGHHDIDPITVRGPLTTYFYISPEATAVEAADTRTETGVLPNVRMDVTVRSGREGREILATGSSPVMQVLARVGQPSVYEFVATVRPLDPTSDTWILPMDGWRPNLRVSFHMLESPLDPRTELMPSNWHVHTGAAYPPRVIVPVDAPLRSKSATVTQVLDGIHFARWEIASSFGEYDVDETGLRATIIPPKGTERPPADAVHLVGIKRDLSCGGPARPLNVTWRIDDANLEPNTTRPYRIVLEATNLQDSYTTIKILEIPRPVTFGGEATVPGPGLVGFLAALLGVLLALRRGWLTRR